VSISGEATAVDGKIIDMSPSDRVTLKRALGPFSLTMIGVSSVIGAGIFVTSGVTAAQNTGPAITLSFLFASVGVLLVALCYCELAAMMPVAGSSYSYISEAMGRFPAWLIAWAMVLEYLITASTIAAGWSGYLSGALANVGIIIPEKFTQVPISLSDSLEFGVTGGYGNFPAALFTLALTGLLALGVRESARVNTMIALLKIAILVTVVAVGVCFINPANWHPFIPPNTGEWGHFGLSGVMRGTALAVWVYTGFETISTCAQEAKNPKRDLAIGMLATMAICTVLYLSVTVVMTGLVPSSELNVADPILVAMNSIGPEWSWLVGLISIGALIGISATVLVTLYGQIRIFYIMAMDGQLPSSFAKVHPKFRTPTTATWFTGIVCAGICFVVPLDVLVDLVSMGTLLAFASVCASVLLFRYKQPDRERPFRVMWSPLLPVLGMLFCLSLMYALPNRTWVQLIVWMILGVLLYRRKRAKAAA
jgi:APA family basic amino acid/polyamine antiporter